MFRCSHGHWSEPGEKMTRVPKEIRSRTYEDGTGWETASEQALCPEHADEHEAREKEKSEAS